MSTNPSTGSGKPEDRRGKLCCALPHAALAALVLALLPLARHQPGQAASFMPAMLALVGCFDLLCALLLFARFVDFGDRRMLALAAAYLTSLVILAGYAAAFPDVLGHRPPLGANSSTAAWLWVCWHSLFPVLLAGALVPWPARLVTTVPIDRRGTLVRVTTGACLLAGLTVVGAVLATVDDLPRIVAGLDTSQRTATVGPAMLPMVAIATVVAMAAASRHQGIERWAALAASTALADVVLTLFSTYRYSIGWYAGRTLTAGSAGVVLAALLIESSGVRTRLAEEGQRLRITLTRTDALERLQHTLLTTMADGVVMQRPGGQVVASNPAAQQLLGLTAAQLNESAPVDHGWQLIDADGIARPTTFSETFSQTVSEATFRTGEPIHDQVVGVRGTDGQIRWVSVNTVAAHDVNGYVDYTISSITDVTQRHAAHRAARRTREEARERIIDVLRLGLITMVFQPIVDLASGRVVGTEALARFRCEPTRPPDQWFAEAETVGLGTELELAAIRSALDELDRLPEHLYLSVNASPTTVMSAPLATLLHDAPAHRLVLELTEHVGVDDYTLLEASLLPLRDRGLRLAVDDAGSGFASMRHILNLHPDLIKLDVALTHGLHKDPARRALVSALLSFSAEINAEIVAEGVETLPELTILQQLGIRRGQGYLLGRPGALPLPLVAPAITAVSTTQP